MIIYEVNLQIELSIFEAYSSWLNTHIQTILTFPGFTKACSFSEISSDENYKKIVVHYYLNTIEDLKNYFEDQAPKMRQEALDLFGQKFLATRRILEKQSEWRE